MTQPTTKMTMSHATHHVAVVHRARIAGTRVEVFSAWEPKAFGPHHTIRHSEEHGWLGQMGRRALPVWLDQLYPVGSSERGTAIDAWRDAQESVAYEAIEAAHPEIVGKGIRRMGEIEVSS